MKETNMTYFTQYQVDQLISKGISLEAANKQLEFFRKGVKPVQLLKPATVQDGIEVFNEKEIKDYIDIWENGVRINPAIKFIPASGAASRMFKTLFEARLEMKKYDGAYEFVFKKNPQVDLFFKGLKKYPFYNDLSMIVHNKGKGLEEFILEKRFEEIIDLLLDPAGLSYGSLPKGLLKFHSYDEGSRTPVEEHLIEAASYLKDTGGLVRIHFTVSPEHRDLFREHTERATNLLRKPGLTDFIIRFSQQDPSTDTLAAEMNNSPFLNDDGTMLFRPGGHGALLKNLETIEEAVVFIGNIDNVAPDRMKAVRVKHKQLLGGILLHQVEKIHSLMRRMDEDLSMPLRNEIIDFISRHISVESAKRLETTEDDKFILLSRELLNRPVRVCGMVKNTGEPGGGPFWIKNKDGMISKQIIESSQVDMNDEKQKEIFNSSTHFNPVDLACYINDYQGNKFRLDMFVDPDMAFIAVKSLGGRELKALELPGLWNGAMAGWISIFVEVPAETFSPVKTIFDLVRPEHI